METIQKDSIEIITRTVRKRPRTVKHKNRRFGYNAGGVIYIPKRYIGHRVLIIPTTRSLHVFRLLQIIFGKNIVKI